MSINETMQDLLKMIGAVELLDEDGRPWWLEWDKDYWRWFPEADRAASTMCRYPCEAQNHICMAAFEWMGKQVETFQITLNGSEVAWVVLRGGDLSMGHASGVLEALYAAVKAVKESKNDH